MKRQNKICPLCKHNSTYYFKEMFLSCSKCKGIHRPIHQQLDTKQEKGRYLEHNNDIYDTRYREFVSPITSAILIKYSTHDKGLDFGAGTGPVISKMLHEAGYSIKQYDPFFHNYPKLLRDSYDYIVCCEVIEHFNNPAKEFSLLRNMLNPGGRLYCMTEIYDEFVIFGNWYYKDDPTHVFIYQRETLDWIRIKFKFDSLKIEGRLIVFSIQ